MYFIPILSANSTSFFIFTFSSQITHGEGVFPALLMLKSYVKKRFCVSLLQWGIVLQKTVIPQKANSGVARTARRTSAGPLRRRKRRAEDGDLVKPRKVRPKLQTIGDVPAPGDLDLLLDPADGQPYSDRKSVV